MQKIFILFALVLGGIAQAARAKSFQDSLEGKWQGFCSPVAIAGTSKMCSYTFFKNGKGAYTCDYYKDLRCGEKEAKTTNMTFSYNLSQPTDKTAKVTLDYSSLDDDVKQEKHRFFITGNVLRVQTYEVVRLPSSKPENLEAQGVVPFFEYTRAK